MTTSSTFFIGLKNDMKKTDNNAYESLFSEKTIDITRI